MAGRHSGEQGWRTASRGLPGGAAWARALPGPPCQPGLSSERSPAGQAGFQEAVVWGTHSNCTASTPGRPFPPPLAQRAEELRREREARSLLFNQGKEAYARGAYPNSALLLERALDEEGPFTPLGGEVQLWLALAYQVWIPGEALVYHACPGGSPSGPGGFGHCTGAARLRFSVPRRP